MDGKNLRRFLVFGVFVLFAVFIMGGVLGEDGEEVIGMGYGTTGSSSGPTFTNSINNFFSEYIVGPAGLILGNIDGNNSGELFFVKFLFALIIFAVVFYSVKQVPNLGKGMTLWVISIAVSLLAIRFLSNEVVINFIWLPQGVLGVALATLLPFILFFFFIESFDSRLIRKVGWSTFAVSYSMLAMLRWDDLEVSGNSIFGLTNLGWFYLIIAGLSVLAILADSGIRSAYLNNKSLNLIRADRELIKAKKKAELVKVVDALADDPDNKALKKREENLEKVIKKINKDLTK